MNESLTEATKASQIACDSIMKAYSEACYANPLVALLLEPLLAKAANLTNRLEQIQDAADNE